MPYLITQRAPVPQEEVEREALETPLSDEEHQWLADVDAAKNALAPREALNDALKTAIENKLIRGYDDIARLNAEERAMNTEYARGRTTYTNGNSYMREGRGHMTVHLMLMNHPDFGPDWWKDDAKFAKYLRDYPEARVTERRQVRG